MDMVNRFVDNIKKEDLHTLYVQIRKDGEVVDYWSRFSKMTRMESYSASKTFCGVGLGIALDQGIIRLDGVRDMLFRCLLFDNIKYGEGVLCADLCTIYCLKENG